MEQDLPKDAGREPAPPTEPVSWFTKFERSFSLVKSLSVVTVLSSLVVGYFQYLNSYQDKVSTQAKENMQAATKTFNDIAAKFYQVHALQQQLLSDFTIALDDHADADAQAMAVKSAPAILKSYEEAQLTLLTTGDLLAKDAETYIDWAAEYRLNPSEKTEPHGDPLDRSLLQAYDFDCDRHMPRFNFSGATADRTQTPDRCLVDDQYNKQPFDNFCPKNKEKADSNKAVAVHWYSAKHQVVTVHHCLRDLHDKMAPVRSWASQAEAKPVDKASLEVHRDRIQTATDLQARRLSVFMNLGAFQINGIRESYRPDSFACHVPIVTSIVEKFTDACRSVRTPSIFTLKSRRNNGNE